MRSIIQIENEHCFYCGRVASEWHHIFGGPNRKLSEEDGLKVRLCWQCHHDVHNGAKSVEMQQTLHELGQAIWEGRCTEKDPHKAFMARYGKNWLEEEDDDQGET